MQEYDLQSCVRYQKQGGIFKMQEMKPDTKRMNRAGLTVFILAVGSFILGIIAAG